MLYVDKQQVINSVCQSNKYIIKCTSVLDRKSVCLRVTANGHFSNSNASKCLVYKFVKLTMLQNLIVYLSDNTFHKYC